MALKRLSFSSRGWPRSVVCSGAAFVRLGSVGLASCLLLSASDQQGLVRFGGLPVPGATVTATQGDKRVTDITDQHGAYSLPSLADGPWKLRVEMLCFEALEREVTVAPGAAPLIWELKTLPFEQIKASAPPPLQTSLAPPRGGIPSPANSKAVPDARASARSRKGVPPPQPANTGSAFQRTEVNASTGASRNEENTGAESAAEMNLALSDGFLINGSVNNGANSPFSQMAAFGNNRRRARSLYHGALGLTFRNSLWDARSFSLTGQNTPKPDYTHVQGIASFGGPLRIPRLMTGSAPNVTINYQWMRNRNATTESARMPTAAEREGDISRSLGALGRPVQAIDPSTGTPFPENTVPQSRISPQARALLSLYPLPNFNSASIYNFQVPLVGSTHQDSLQTRVSKSVMRSNQLNGIFSIQSARADTTTLFGFLDTSGTLGMTTTINWMHQFSMRSFITFGYQFSRQSTGTTPFFAGRYNISAIAGINGNNQEPANWGPPQLSFSSGVASLRDSQSSVTHNQTSVIFITLFRSIGFHNVTMGADLRRQQFNLISQQDPRGNFTFTGTATGSDFAGFLLGIPDTSSIAFGNADKYFRSSIYDAYFSDDWRCSPSLTISAGARWEYSSPTTELYGRLVNLDIGSGFSAIAPVVAASPTGSITGRSYPDSLVHPDKHAIQPRIGLSWRPRQASSMVIRTGYGVYYDMSTYMPIASRMAQQSPLSKSFSVANTTANPLTLANAFFAPRNVTANTFAVDPNLLLGYSQNWQVSIQHDMPGSLVMIATYLGIKGTRAQQQFLPHTYPTGTVNPCPSCPTGYAFLTSNGNSTRHSGQIQLRRRLHSGFTAQLNYTFSKAIDDAAVLGGRGQGAAEIAQDWLNLSGERGPSNFDQRHLVTALVQYTTGMGLAGGTLLDSWRGRLIKDWTFTSNLNAGTGMPQTPIYLSAVRGTGITGSIRPDYTGAPLYDAPPGLFLNPAAVAAPPTDEWGNAGRNSIRGPAQFWLNASIARTFRLSDHVNADFRLDAVNALNYVTFKGWNVVATSSQFGLPTAAGPMRNLQASMRMTF